MIAGDSRVTSHGVCSPQEQRAGLWVSSCGRFTTRTHVCPERVIPEYVFIYCVEGRGHFTCGNSDYVITAGQAFVTFPDIIHSYWNDPAVGWDIWYFHFAGDLCERLVELAGYTFDKPVVNLGINAEVVQKFESICAILDRNELQSAIDAGAIVYQMFLLQRKINAGLRMDRHGLGKVIGRNFETVDQMAEAANMSKYHFIRVFRDAVGQTPWNYILSQRISKACGLLVSSDKPVKQISKAVGFSDPDYFSKIFRKYAGIGAREYRRLHKPA